MTRWAVLLPISVVLFVVGCAGTAMSSPSTESAATATHSPSATPTAPPATEQHTLTPTDAADRVAAFVGQPGITGDLIVNGPDDAGLYDVQNSHVVALVDPASGIVLSVLYLGSGNSDGKGPTGDEAIAIAETYLRDHGVDFDGMTRTEQRMDHGETWEWAIQWVRMAGDVILPDSVVVGVNPSGQVFRFGVYQRPYTSPPTPTVDQATAEATARQAAFGDAPSQIDSTALKLKVDESGNQRLVWEIAVTEEPMSHAVVEVDALTGAATIIAVG
jgi:hypothetical protein